jgi:hypothetical protein
MDFALRISRVELDVSAAFLGSEAATIVGKSTEGSSFTLLDARAGACFLALYTTRWSLGPCARIGPEAIFAKGFGSDQPANVTAVVLAPSFGLLGEAMLTSHVGLRLVLDAEIPLTRPDFFIAEGASSRQGVFTLPVIAARGSLGAVVRF